MVFFTPWLHRSISAGTDSHKRQRAGLQVRRCGRRCYLQHEHAWTAVGRSRGEAVGSSVLARYLRDERAAVHCKHLGRARLYDRPYAAGAEAENQRREAGREHHLETIGVFA